MKKIIVIGLIVLLAVLSLNASFARPANQIPEMQVGLMYIEPLAAYKFAYAIENQGTNFTQTSMFYLRDYVEGEVFDYDYSLIGRMLPWMDINTPLIEEGDVYIIAVRLANGENPMSMDPDKTMWSEYYAYRVHAGMSGWEYEFICHVR